MESLYPVRPIVPRYPLFAEDEDEQDFVPGTPPVRGTARQALTFIGCLALLASILTHLDFLWYFSPLSSQLARSASAVIAVFVAVSFFSNYLLIQGANNSVGAGQMRLPAFFLLLILVFQIFLGAVMRGSGSQYAVLDFPTIGGSFFPSFDSALITNINGMRSELGLADVTGAQIVVHLLHRLGGFVAFFGAVWVSLTVLRSREPAPRSVIPALRSACTARPLHRFAALILVCACMSALGGAAAILNAPGLTLSFLHTFFSYALLTSATLLFRASQVRDEAFF